MSYLSLLIVLGLANWIITLIIVESELVRPVRQFFDLKTLKEDYSDLWHKLSYLVKCHLCTGTWVALLMAAFISPVISVPFAGWLFTGFIIKAIGHLSLVVHKAGDALINFLKVLTETYKRPEVRMKDESSDFR